MDDKEPLVKASLDWKMVEDLPARTGACRYLQSQWMKEYRSIEAAEQEWKEKSPIAYDLRDELLHHFSFAFNNSPDLYASYKKIAEGSGHADMIQDLSDLSALGKANPEPFVPIKSFNMVLLDKVDKIAEESAEILAKSNGEKYSDNVLRVLRDKAYTHLKESIDEIRRVGQYVFWRDDNRRKGYISKYAKRKRQKRNKDKNNGSEAK